MCNSPVRSQSRELLARRPERLVVSGFRNMMAAYELSDSSCWEAVWRQCIEEVGAPAARRIVGELQYWTRSIRTNAERPVHFFPHCCLNLCHDECMALSMISAAQAGDEDAGFLAASFLIGSKDDFRVQDVWQAAGPLAMALEQTGQLMYPVSLAVVRSIAEMQRMATNAAGAQRLN